MEEWMDVWMSRQFVGRMDEVMDGQTDGYMENIVS
jgi:hypothetical protein